MHYLIINNQVAHVSKYLRGALEPLEDFKNLSGLSKYNAIAKQIQKSGFYTVSAFLTDDKLNKIPIFIPIS